MYQQDAELFYIIKSSFSGLIFLQLIDYEDSLVLNWAKNWPLDSSKSCIKLSKVSSKDKRQKFKIMWKGKVDPISAEIVQKADIPKWRVPKKKNSSNLAIYKIKQIGEGFWSKVVWFFHANLFQKSVHITTNLLNCM